MAEENDEFVITFNQPGAARYLNQLDLLDNIEVISSSFYKLFAFYLNEAHYHNY